MTQGRTLQSADLANDRVASLERLPRNLGTVVLSKKVGLDRQGHVGIGMAELTTEEHVVERLDIRRLAQP
jgi:hypothetical protein